MSEAETAPAREMYWDKVLDHELQKLDRILLRQRNKAEDEIYAILKEFEMMNEMEDEPQQQKEASMPVITGERRTDVCFVNAFRSLGSASHICGTALSGHLPMETRCCAALGSWLICK